MNLISRTITGGLMVFAGIFIFFIPFLFGVRLGMFSLLYSLPLIVIGFFVLFNKKEDKIEERKDLNKIKTKK